MYKINVYIVGLGLLMASGALRGSQLKASDENFSKILKQVESYKPPQSIQFIDNNDWVLTWTHNGKTLLKHIAEFSLRAKSPEREYSELMFSQVLNKGKGNTLFEEQVPAVYETINLSCDDGMMLIDFLENIFPQKEVLTDQESSEEDEFKGFRDSAFIGYADIKEFGVTDLEESVLADKQKLSGSSFLPYE